MDNGLLEDYAAMVKVASNYSAVKNRNSATFSSLSPSGTNEAKLLSSFRKEGKIKTKKESERSNGETGTLCLQGQCESMTFRKREKGSDSERNNKNTLFTLRGNEGTVFSSPLLKQGCLSSVLDVEEVSSATKPYRSFVPACDGHAPGDEDFPVMPSFLEGVQRSASHHSLYSSCSLRSNPPVVPLRTRDVNQLQPGPKGPEKMLQFPFPFTTLGNLPSNEALGKHELYRGRDNCRSVSDNGESTAAEGERLHDFSGEEDADAREMPSAAFNDGYPEAETEWLIFGESTITSVSSDGELSYRHNPYPRSVCRTISSSSFHSAGEERENSLCEGESVLSSYSLGDASDYCHPALVPSRNPVPTHPGSVETTSIPSTHYFDPTADGVGPRHSAASGTFLNPYHPAVSTKRMTEEATVSSRPYFVKHFDGIHEVYDRSSCIPYNLSGMKKKQEEAEGRSRNSRSDKQDVASKKHVILTASENSERVVSTPSSLSSFSSSAPAENSPLLYSGSSSSSASSFAVFPSTAKEASSFPSHPSSLSDVHINRSHTSSQAPTNQVMVDGPSFPLEEHFTSILPHLEEAACTPQGRQILIYVLRQRDPEKNNLILHRLLPMANSFFLDPNGCHLARALVEKVSTSELLPFLRTLYPSTIYRLCTTSQHTRRVVQAIFECHQGPELTPLAEVLAQDACRLSVTQQGCIVIKNVFVCATLAQKALFLPFLMPMLAKLAVDPYGNYVIQALIENSNGVITIEELNEAFAHHRLQLCCHKCASNVMEKLVSAVTGPTRCEVVRELVFDERHCHALLLNCFGNFVLQAIIQSSNEPAEFQVIYETVASYLSNSPYGQKISAKLQGKYREIFQSEPPPILSSVTSHDHRHHMEAILCAQPSSHQSAQGQSC